MHLEQLAARVNFEHSRMVSAIGGILASKTGCSTHEISIITQAALFHDIGKDAIPPSILNKRGALTPAEFEIVKTHTDAGYKQLIDAANVMNIAAIAAKEHHEKIDGSGYIGLAGDNIHPYAKLISVADVFDALVSKRAYKDSWSINEVCNYFKCESGHQFEPVIVQILLAVLDEVLALYK